MLYLVTGNNSKFENAVKRLSPFGIEIEMRSADLVEPQKDSIEEVAKFKIAQAFDLVKGSVLITDTGWSIPSLKGFPGPYMHYISDWFTLNDWLNLLKDKKDREIRLENIAVYKDKEITKIFISRRIGKLLEESKGVGLPIDTLATFRKDNKTISECKELNIDSFDDTQEPSIWTQFGEWYKGYQAN